MKDKNINVNASYRSSTYCSNPELLTQRYQW